ncbi:hypothetical protein IWX46DRAFT_578233 [Phyllosticta citricarpa]|uniref:Uncharacterized protein n=1 Tax=Phyllosticta citricarpa TaxID=55181 RepID=A0ABR1MMN8_9PEZI
MSTSLTFTACVDFMLGSLGCALNSFLEKLCNPRPLEPEPPAVDLLVFSISMPFSDSLDLRSSLMVDIGPRHQPIHAPDVGSALRPGMVTYGRRGRRMEYVGWGQAYEFHKAPSLIRVGQLGRTRSKDLRFTERLAWQLTAFAPSSPLHPDPDPDPPQSLGPGFLDARVTPQRPASCKSEIPNDVEHKALHYTPLFGVAQHNSALDPLLWKACSPLKRGNPVSRATCTGDALSGANLPAYSLVLLPISLGKQSLSPTAWKFRLHRPLRSQTRPCEPLQDPIKRFGLQFWHWWPCLLASIGRHALGDRFLTVDQEFQAAGFLDYPVGPHRCCLPRVFQDLESTLEAMSRRLSSNQWKWQYQKLIFGSCTRQLGLGHSIVSACSMMNLACRDSQSRVLKGRRLRVLRPPNY